MAQAAARIAATLTAIFLSGSLALAQQTPTPQPAGGTGFTPTEDWATASYIASSKHKLILLTLAEPTHRHACHVQSFTVDQLTCKDHFGKSRIYKPEEIAALIIPVDSGDRPRTPIGVKIAVAGVILGNIAVAGLCGPCVAPIALASLFIFGLDAALSIRGERSYSYLYIAPIDKLYDPKGNPIRLKPLS